MCHKKTALPWKHWSHVNAVFFFSVETITARGHFQVKLDWAGLTSLWFLSRCGSNLPSSGGGGVGEGDCAFSVYWTLKWPLLCEAWLDMLEPVIFETSLIRLVAIWHRFQSLWSSDLRKKRRENEQTCCSASRKRGWACFYLHPAADVKWMDGKPRGKYWIWVKL